MISSCNSTRGFARFPAMFFQRNNIYVAVITACLAPSVFANLVPNPGFEAGSSSALWGGSTVVKTNKRTGTYGAEIPDNAGYQQTISGLSPNTTYTFSAYVKTVGGSAVIGVKNHGAAQMTESFNAAGFILVDIEFTTGDGVTSADCFVYNGAGGATMVYADDLSLSLTGIILPPLAGAVGDYELVFSDEFNTEGAIDLTKWKPEIGFQRNEEEQYYQAENLSQTGGNLVITAKRETVLNANYDPNSGDWRKKREYAYWTSGSILTVDSFDFLYGKIECRAKVSNLQGTWPAIWTVGAGAEWPAGGEIDIMENYKGEILANFAIAKSGRWEADWNATSRRNVSTLGANWADSFHTWELVWSPTSAAILLDGVTLNSYNPATKNHSGSFAYPNVAPFQTFAQLLWLNLAIGGGGGGDSSGLPNETVYLVDYIRVYQRQHPGFQSNMAMLNADDVRLDFNTVKGRRYSVKESTDLSSWTPLTNLRGTGQTMSHAAEDSLGGPRKFFRVEADNTQWIDPATPVP